MKVLAQKHQSLSLELPIVKRRRNSASESSGGSLKNSFTNWLRAITPQTKNPTLRYSLVNPRIAVASSAEFMRVSVATVREGWSGRVWPPEVLRKFQMAEVVTETSISHYVLSDRSVRRLSI